MAKATSKATIGKESINKKDKYRVSNWKDYNRSLIKRGSLEIWIDEGAINNWLYKGPNQKGAQYKFSDACIICLLQLKVVYKLPYRQLEGFINSIFRRMNIGLSAPSYTQICRRAKTIEVEIEAPKTKGPIYLVIDSTGLKVYGDGEWKARKHGVSKRRTWRKLHLGVDEQTGMIHTEMLTENGKGDGDAQQVKEMLNKVNTQVDRFSGDGAYDTYDVWELLKERFIEGIIPPQENAIYWVDEYDELLDLGRNKILERIDEIGRKEWKEESHYHRRSLSETAMMRIKKIFGSELNSRIFEKQKKEATIKVRCLNKMTKIGMPKSIKIAS